MRSARDGAAPCAESVLIFVIPLNEVDLKMLVKEWGIHYHRGRLPEPTQENVPVSDQLPAGHRIEKTAALGGLHH